MEHRAEAEGNLLAVCMSVQPLLRGLLGSAKLSLTEQMAIGRLEKAIEPVYAAWAEGANRRAA